MRLGNLLILGDSFSTFEGWIPEGYDCYYKSAGRPETDVTRVEETWWYRLMSRTETNLVRNSSFSGSTVCHTGYDGKDYIEVSFVTRLERLVKQGFFEENTIDTVLIFGGTNDSCADAPVGEIQYKEWTTEDLYQVLPAFAYFVKRIKEILPGANVFCIMNTDLKAEVTSGYAKICGHYQVPFLQLNGLDKKTFHPTILGMQQIEEQVYQFLETCL